MLDAVKSFIGLYANVNNILIVGLCAVSALLLLDFILYLCAYSTLKRINKCLRTWDGEEIIPEIEKMKKHGRYHLMWEDYYDAYTKENTVSLNSYLLKDDMLVKRNVIKAISRGVVLICIALMVIASVKVTGLLKSEKYDILCAGGILVGLQTVCEILYYIFDTGREKRLLRLLEEFRILSLRKLPGRAVDFEAMHYLMKIEQTEESIRDVYGAVLTQNARIDTLTEKVDQVNNRLDRQYNEIVSETEDNK